MKKKKKKKVKVVKNYQRLARDLLLKVFYSYDHKGYDLKSILEEYTSLKKVNQEVLDHAKKVINFFEDNREKVDELIKSHLEKWRFERLGYIERALLRIAFSELLMLKEEGKDNEFFIKRLILDTLDLVECYTSSKESVKFVNGVLGRVSRELFKNYEDSIHI
ncbi:MAG: transcription antitermination factor NusB [Sulfurihydrogenibium sp.]|nr:MAG: transcription antitermination factor NusB [Sulfurihydrogenibium sp.]